MSCEVCKRQVSRIPLPNCSVVLEFGEGVCLSRGGGSYRVNFRGPIFSEFLKRATVLSILTSHWPSFVCLLLWQIRVIPPTSLDEFHDSLDIWKLKPWGRRADLAVRSSHWSCRGPGFCFKHPHDGLQPSSSRRSYAYFWLLRALGSHVIHIPACRQDTHM